jgi:DNA topoisomerase IA
MGSVMTWLAPIVVAVIGGFFSYLGVAKTATATFDKSIADIRMNSENQIAVIKEQITGIKEDIQRLEKKQDKHNSLIERTFKLEQKVEELDKRIK